jgi:hypothetical protein
MGLLVTDLAIFQFLLLDQTTRFAGCLRSRVNGACILLCAHCARCDGSCREQELGQRDFLVDGAGAERKRGEGRYVTRCATNWVIDA